MKHIINERGEEFEKVISEYAHTRKEVYGILLNILLEFDHTKRSKRNFYIEMWKEKTPNKGGKKQCKIERVLKELKHQSE